MRKSLQLALAGTLTVMTSYASAQTAANYPNREVRLIVPYAPGGVDTYVRPLEDALRNSIGLRFVIMNQTGAGGIIGTNAAKRSEADGYTLLFGATSLLAIAPRFQKAEYEIKDFSPVMQLISAPQFIAVRKDAPYQNLQQLIDYAKKNPGKITYGTNGVGTATHLFMEALQFTSGTQLLHVPFTGIAPAVTALLGGHIDAVIGPPGNIQPQAENGQLTVIAVTSKQRFKLAPDLPTVRELGYDVDVAANFGFLAPNGTPKEIIEKLYTAIKAAASDANYQNSMAKLYAEVLILGPEDFGKALDAEDKMYGDLIATLPKQNLEAK